jgi:hypothetical protein
VLKFDGAFAQIALLAGSLRAAQRRSGAASLRSIFLCAALVTAFLGFARTADGHVMGVSTGDYTPAGSRVGAEIALRTADAALAVPGLDADGDGRVSQAEVDRAAAALKAAFFDPLEVLADGAPCTPALEGALLDPPDGLRLRASFACAAAPSRLHLRFGFLDRMPSDHRHLATVHLARGDVEALAVFTRPDMELLLGEAPSRGFVSFLRGGIEHILTGADHLAFLTALVLGGTLIARDLKKFTQIGPLMAMLTAFTIGHSISLGVATLAGFAPSPRFIEPAVALSVAYVGAENLFARSVGHRWVLTFPFGLVHGFALAGGLLPLGLPRAQLPAALFAFNLGVEAGQLLVLAILLPPLVWLRSRGWYPVGARALSAAIAIAGMAWFFQRIV